MEVNSCLNCLKPFSMPMGSLWWILNGLRLHYQSSGPEMSLISLLMQSSLVTTRYLLVPGGETQHWETMSWSMKDFPWNLNFFLYSGNITKQELLSSPPGASSKRKHCAVTQSKTGTGKSGTGAHSTHWFPITSWNASLSSASLYPHGFLQLHLLNNRFLRSYLWWVLY